MLRLDQEGRRSLSPSWHRAEGLLRPPLQRPEDTLGFQHGDVSLDPGKLQQLKPMPIQEKPPPAPTRTPQLRGQAGLQRCKPSARMLATA